ncbi:MAG: N-formylglutamate amidohydrolase [Gammaproteobacteria bacterium]
MPEHTMLIEADEPAAYEVLETRPDLPVLLVCDHASNRIPRVLGDLGVSAEALTEHIAWDIGAAAVTREMARHLNVPAILGTYSRLVVDCNRNLDDPTAFPARSDEVPVPGNSSLDQATRELRANTLYWPYHHAIRDHLRLLESLAPAPALIAIHSFTPVWDSDSRPWHLGILWDKDGRIPHGLLDYFERHPEIVVGDNLPYSGKHPADFTIDYHAEAAGLPHVSIEIRQDLIDSAEGAKHWAGVLCSALDGILQDRNLYSLRAGLQEETD